MAASGIRKAGRRAGRRWRLPGPLWAAGFLLVATGLAVLVVACRGGGGGDLPADTSGGEPFQGGARAYFPVQSLDLGRVPFNEVVSRSFSVRNVGDAPLRIEDVQVAVLEGC